MKKYRLHGLGLCLALALLSTASLVPTSQAQPVSPAGTWDLIISGSEKGVAYITFDDAGSLSGYEAIGPSKPGSIDDPIEIERISGDAGRVITTTSGSSSNTTIQTILGFGLLSGTWSYDIKGNIIGVYTEGSENRSCLTNDEITAVVSNAIIDFK